MKVLSRKILVIPRGWRKMRTGTIFRKGDLWIFSDMDDDVWYEPFHGNEEDCNPDAMIGERVWSDQILIRRIHR